MSLRPTALALGKNEAMFVVIDDKDGPEVLLIPCSWNHRQVRAREDLDDFELHRPTPATDDEALREVIRDLRDLADTNLVDIDYDMFETFIHQRADRLESLLGGETE